tara:strand:+ start:29313 stop:30242 length:930 start_codon:yes stop_codon:yes gene_type:complete
MILVLTVTIPIFVVILAGYISAKRGIMGKESIKAFTTFVFYFCLPLLLFRNLANAPVAEQLRGDYVLAYLLAGLMSFAVGYAVARWIFKCSVAEQAVQGLAVSFGHTVFMTIPIGFALYGEASVLPIALLITVEMAFIVPLAIVLLEIHSQERSSLIAVSGTALRAVFFNPIVPSILLGVAAAMMGVKIPAVLNGLVNLVQGATVPLCAFCDRRVSGRAFLQRTPAGNQFHGGGQVAALSPVGFRFHVGVPGYPGRVAQHRHHCRRHTPRRERLSRGVHLWHLRQSNLCSDPGVDAFRRRDTVHIGGAF